MTFNFKAEAIARTENIGDAKRLEITFSDSTGRLETVSITAATARSLSSALQDFAAESHSDGRVATKMPLKFAVGIGQFEQLVLVRFEDDTPYGLETSQAAELGRALVEHAKKVSAHRMTFRH